MNQTDLIKNSDLSLGQAEQNVKDSLHRFEVAMDQLAYKVEGTVYPFHRARHFVWNTKLTVQYYKDLISSAFVAALVPYMNKAKFYTNRAVIEVRANPKPYLWAAAGITAGVLIAIYWRNRNGVR